VLSGVLDDSTSGLWSVKHLGGIAIVQLPDQARFDSMPRNAMEYVEVDYSLPSTEIGSLIGRLVMESPMQPVEDKETRARMEFEGKIAAEDNAFPKAIIDLGTLTPFTCPECHGALVRMFEGKMSRFRCHTGHAYSDSALLQAVMESSGEMLWQVIRSYEESVMLLNHMADHLENAGDQGRSNIFRRKAVDLERRSRTFHAAVLEHESLSGDNLGPLPEGETEQ
jgi:two-component system chemotaxis response regulator CheB